MAVLLPPPYLQFLDDDGVPLAFGTVDTYAATTTTRKATYTDSSAAFQAPNPVQLDASGIPQTGNGSIWIQGAYKFIVKSQDGSFTKTTDNVVSFSAATTAVSSYFQSFSGNGAQTSFTLSQNLGDDEKTIMVYVSNDSATADDLGFQIQNPSAYTLTGTNITFAVAPATGTNNIYIFAPSTYVGAAAQYAAAADASATAAGNSAAAAAVSAATATTQAGIATTQAATATTQAGIATTQAATATTQAGNASTSATNANNSAIAAAASAVLAASTFIGTSTTSNTIGAGAKSFTTQINKNFQAGQWMIISDSGNPANYMFGTVTSYNNGSGALVFNSTNIGGSGTLTSWNISISGIKGVDGVSGITALTGDVTATGPGSAAATIANNAVTTSKILNANVTLAKIANAAANSKLVGSGAAGSGAAYSEITLGTNLSMSGTTLNAAGTAPVEKMTVFTSSGTFTTSANITTSTAFKFVVVGGGGGGGAASTANGAAGGGGSGGGCAIYMTTGLTPSTGYTVTVGSGGASASSGGASTVVLGGTTPTGGAGGNGGSATANTAAVTGGGSTVGSNGTINISGGSGGNGICSTTAALASGGIGGAGGGPYNGGNVFGSIAGGDGGLGTFYGGGGGGGARLSGNQVGGAGRGGIVTVEWVE